MKVIQTFSIVFLNVAFLQAQWQPDVRLTNDPGWSTTSFNNAWCIASSGDTVHVVWYDNRDGNYEIYYKRSTDNGINWGPDTRLTDNSASSEYPALAVSGSFVHIVWYDFRDGNYEIYYKHSTDGGTNWEADVQLTFNSYPSYCPSLSVSNSIVSVVWIDGRDSNWEIYYKRSTDKGITWDSDTRLTNASSDSFNPSVSVTGSNVNVVWYDRRDGNYGIYYRRSSDSGMNWEADTCLTNNSGSSIAPCIFAAASNVHVVWQDDRDGAYKIFYKHSSDEGMTWGQDTCLTEEDSSFLPSIAVSDMKVHLVWAFEYPLNREIFYKRSIDNGITWEQEIRLTDAPKEGWLPSVSISDSILHLVWRDERDGNTEIYYKRYPNANVTGIENINAVLTNGFNLEQNYPNPFNPRTKISYSIPTSPSLPLLTKERVGVRFVTLKVYDILGKEVVVLVNEEQPAGVYELNWNAANLPSGIYFYQLTAGDFIQTKKMILLK